MLFGLSVLFPFQGNPTKVVLDLGPLSVFLVELHELRKDLLRAIHISGFVLQPTEFRHGKRPVHTLLEMIDQRLEPAHRIFRVLEIHVREGQFNERCVGIGFGRMRSARIRPPRQLLSLNEDGQVTNGLLPSRKAEVTVAGNEIELAIHLAVGLFGNQGRQDLCGLSPPSLLVAGPALLLVGYVEAKCA